MMYMILYYLFYRFFLARETGTRQFLAIKALKKTYVLNRDMVAATFVEKRVLSLGSTFPYLPTHCIPQSSMFNRLFLV